MSDADRERRKEYMKINSYQRKNLLINFIKYVEDLENISLHQQISTDFKYYESF